MPQGGAVENAVACALKEKTDEQMKKHLST